MSSNNKRKPIEDFDDILEYVGGWGPFQYYSTLVFFLFNIFLGYVYLSPIITLYTPPHFCKIPDLIEANVSLEDRRNLAIPPDPEVIGGFSQCKQYNVNWIEILDDLKSDALNTTDNSWDVVPCQDGWDYDMEGYHVSISVEHDWVCDKAWIPALSQSLFFVGAIPGMIFFGWLSDAYGRMPTIIISNVICLITGVITPFVTEHISFMVLRFMMGLAFNTFFTAPYVLGKIVKYQISNESRSEFYIFFQSWNLLQLIKGHLLAILDWPLL